MPYQGLIGAAWPDGPDYASQMPGMFKNVDAALARGTRLRVNSLDERKQLVPSPGANEHWTVDCSSLGLTWEWTGRDWVEWGWGIEQYTGFWRSGTTNIDPGSGGSVTSYYQRCGYYVRARIVTFVGDGCTMGGDNSAYEWYLSYPPRDMYGTGVARIRLRDTREWSATVGFKDNTTIYVARDGGRINKSSFPWSSGAGDQILIDLTYLRKV